ADRSRGGSAWPSRLRRLQPGRLGERGAGAAPRRRLSGLADRHGIGGRGVCAQGVGGRFAGRRKWFLSGTWQPRAARSRRGARPGGRGGGGRVGGGGEAGG